MLCVKEINMFGDLICPACGAAIITPPAFKLVPGIGACPLCRRGFKLDQVTCERANRAATKSRGAANAQSASQAKGATCA